MKRSEMTVFIKVLPITSVKAQFIFWTKDDASDAVIETINMRDMTTATTPSLEVRIQRRLDEIFNTRCTVIDKGVWEPETVEPTPLTEEELTEIIANDEDLQNETK